MIALADSRCKWRRDRPLPLLPADLAWFERNGDNVYERAGESERKRENGGRGERGESERVWCDGSRGGEGERGGGGKLFFKIFVISVVISSIIDGIRVIKIFLFKRWYMY